MLRSHLYHIFALALPSDRIVVTDVNAHSIVAHMTISGKSLIGYIDTLIASMAKQHQAEGTTTDPSSVRSVSKPSGSYMDFDTNSFYRSRIYIKVLILWDYEIDL